jgi:uncharacterized protein
LNAFASKMGAQPSAMPQMLVALIRSITPPQQIVLAGDEIAPFVDALRTRFLPHHTLLKTGDVPAAENMPAVDGRATAYLCENFACRMPTTDPAELFT